jgi:hypothetical protein
MAGQPIVVVNITINNPRDAKDVQSGPDKSLTDLERRIAAKAKRTFRAQEDKDQSRAQEDKDQSRAQEDKDQSRAQVARKSRARS